MGLLSLLLFFMPMWVTDDVNVRTAPGFHGEIVDVLETGEEVKTLMTVQRERSWTIVETDEGLRAVCTDYLTDEEPEPAMHLWGTATITHYCNCSECCGQWAGGGTASGTTPTAGRTVAADLPFGTRLLINGHEYTVEDSGVYGCWVDIYCDSHAEALARGMYQTEVYIIDG